MTICTVYATDKIKTGGMNKVHLTNKGRNTTNNDRILYKEIKLFKILTFPSLPWPMHR